MTQPSDPLIVRLASGRRVVVALILAQVLLALTLRLVLFSGASPDDGEQLVHIQAWRWTYDPENPPLVTWAIIPLNALFGPGLLPVVLLRLAALMAFYAALAVLAWQALDDRRLAALAVLSPMSLWFVGWDSLLNYTHSIALMAGATGFLAAACRTRDRPDALGFAAIGVLAGLGMLAKYSMALLLLGAAGAALLDPVWRQRLRDPRLFLVPLAFAAVAGPHLAAALLQADIVAESAQAYFHRPVAGMRSLAGLNRLGKALIEFPIPFAVLVVIAFARSFRLGVGTGPNRSARLFLVRTLLATLLVTALVIVVFQVSFLRSFHLMLLAWAPVAVFALVDGTRVSDRLATGFGAALCALMAVIVVAMPLKALVIDPPRCGKCHLNIPYADYAGPIRAAGFNGGGIVSFSTDFAEPGENLVRYLPASRLYVVKMPWFEPPAAAPGKGGDCLVVWDAGRDPDLPARYRNTPLPYAGAVLPEDARVGETAHALRFGDRSALTLGYAIVEGGLGRCR